MKYIWQVLIILLVIVLFLSMVPAIRFYKLPEWLSKNWRFHAITLPPFGIFLANTAINDETINHEIIHWQQFEKLGLFGFYFNYILGWLKYGYRNNPMEIEAYGS